MHKRSSRMGYTMHKNTEIKITVLMSHRIRQYQRTSSSDRERVTTGGEREREYETHNSALLLSLWMSVSCKHIHTHTQTHTRGHAALQAAGCSIYPYTEIYINTQRHRALVWAVSQHGVREETPWTEWQLVDRIWHTATLPQRLQEAQCHSALHGSSPFSQNYTLPLLLFFHFLQQPGLSHSQFPFFKKKLFTQFQEH